MAKKTKKTKKKAAAKKRDWFGRKPTPKPKAKPSEVKDWPAGSPDPDDVQRNDKGEHIIDRPAGGEWVFKLKTNKKFIVQES